jgi:hypothetical protein
MCVCVCSLSYPARTVSCPVLSCVAVPKLSTLSHKRHDFRKRKKLLKIKYLFFSPQLLSEIFLILGKIQRDAVINLCRPSCRVLFILVKFYWKLSFVDRFSKNAQMSNFMKIRSMGAELFHLNWRNDGRTDGEKDMTKLIVAFRSFANAPKESFYIKSVHSTSYTRVYNWE